MLQFKDENEASCFYVQSENSFTVPAYALKPKKIFQETT